MPNLNEIMARTVADTMSEVMNNHAEQNNRRYGNTITSNGISDTQHIGSISADIPAGIDYLIEVDHLCMSAEHAVSIADDLAHWAEEAPNCQDAVTRWQAVAVTRAMANDRWSAATRRLRAQLSGTV